MFILLQGWLSTVCQQSWSQCHAIAMHALGTKVCGGCGVVTVVAVTACTAWAGGLGPRVDVVQPVSGKHGLDVVVLNVVVGRGFCFVQCVHAPARAWLLLPGQGWWQKPRQGVRGEATTGCLKVLLCECAEV